MLSLLVATDIHACIYNPYIHAKPGRILTLENLTDVALNKDCITITLPRSIISIISLEKPWAFYHAVWNETH